ncbi:MAG TPA: sigma-70 family RNA polymerase sigma factor [Gammaproteobacteria bacterium]
MNRARDRRSDEELIEACNRGGAAEAARAFETLYRRHRDYVLRVAMRFARNREVALEALQETFAYLLEKFPPVGPGLVLTARLQTLLYPVAKNCAISALRKTGRDRELEGVEPDDFPAGDAPCDSGAVEAALARLDADRRELLTLRFVDGLSLAEIADVLEVPLGTVKSRLHLAIKQLREDPRIKDLFDR